MAREISTPEDRSDPRVLVVRAEFISFAITPITGSFNITLSNTSLTFFILNMKYIPTPKAKTHSTNKIVWWLKKLLNPIISFVLAGRSAPTS